MALAMSRPWRDPSTGIWYLRKRVPKDLLAVVGREVHKVSLGLKDPVEAKRRHTQALATLEARWANLRDGPKSLTEIEAHEIARTVYDGWLKRFSADPNFQFAWHTDLYPTLWTAPLLPEVEPQPGVPGSMPITNMFYRSMRLACFDRADELLAERGLDVDDWGRQKLAKAVAAALQRASLYLARQAQGYLEPEDGSHRRTGRSVTADLTEVSERARPQSGRGSADIKISQILSDWWNEAKAAGRKPSTYESYRNSANHLIRFLEHDDATRVTPENVVAFKNHRLATPSERTGKVPSPKTVKDSDLAALKTLFGWAVVNHKLPANPAAGLTIKLGKAPRLRGKGFTDAEAQAILAAAYRYRNEKERPATVAAKRWVPWLCAFTGARVGEMAQLRRQDVRRHGDDWVIHITPEAGTQKTNEARDVPLHRQLVELGFPEFAQACPEGPLFLSPAKDGDVLGPLQGLKNRLAEFGRSLVPDPRVAPNHGWRHRFKTVGREVGIDSRLLDAIQGQVARSVADAYGDITLKATTPAIAKLPTFDIAEFKAETECTPHVASERIGSGG